MQIKNRQQLLVIATVAVIGLFVGDKLLLTPLLNAWDARAGRITALRKQVAANQALIFRQLPIRSHWRDIATRTVVSKVQPNATWIDIGFTDIETSKWSMDYARPYYAQQRMTADPVTTVPQLTKLLKERIGKTSGLAEKIAQRKEAIGKRHAETRAKWSKQAQEHWDSKPMTVPRLALEVWDAIKGEDWVLTAGDLGSWGKKL